MREREEQCITTRIYKLQKGGRRQACTYSRIICNILYSSSAAFTKLLILCKLLCAQLFLSLFSLFSCYVHVSIDFTTYFFSRRRAKSVEEMKNCQTRSRELIHKCRRCRRRRRHDRREERHKTTKKKEIVEKKAGYLYIFIFMVLIKIKSLHDSFKFDTKFFHSFVCALILRSIFLITS